MNTNRLGQFLLPFLALCFFFIYAWLYASTPDIFNSPDENASFVFIDHFIKQGDLKLSMPENPGNVIRPRSVNIVGDNYVPGSFLGLILLNGYAGQIFGRWSINFLPSLIAVCGVLAYYGIIRRIFSQKVAIFSALLLFFLPQWWHYAARGFIPNVTFLSLLMIGVYLALKAHEACGCRNNSGYWLSALSGLAMLAALAVRPNELWWVLGGTIAVLYYYRRSIHWSAVWLAALVFVIASSFVFFWQYQTYGGFLSTGYDQFQSGQAPAGTAINIVQTFFPFGLHALTSLENFWRFAWNLFSWQTLLIILGLFAWKSGKISDKQRFYVILVSAISVYLAFYYGSWQVADDIDPERFSIGISYVRYWLFISLAFLPFIVHSFGALSQKFKDRKSLAFISFVSAFVMTGIFYTLSVGDDNLGLIRQNIVEYDYIRMGIMSGIVASTPEDSVIISERNDKVFWPDRQVIHFQDQNYEFLTNLPEVVRLYPVYWFTPLPNSHVRVIEQKEFAAYGLSLQYVKDYPGGNSLYKVLKNE